MVLPGKFTSRMAELLGPSRLERFLAALDEPQPVSIRLNPAKNFSPLPPHPSSLIPHPSTLIPHPSSLIPHPSPIPWCPEGYYLAHRPAFTFDPLLHAGCYYVQEAASMFIAHVARQLLKQPVAVLDMCAAPGGKSTALIASLPQGSMLVSNEPVRQRAQILLENIQKWGYPGCLVTNNYPEAFRGSRLQFDVVVCDVPCSGEGMFRKEAEAVAQWTPELVSRCAGLQRSIVEAAWECLRPGGLLMYSTCTFNTEENEENVAWMVRRLGAEPVGIDKEASWGIEGSLLAGTDLPVCRFIPGLIRSEGLFMAVLRKPGDGSATPRSRIADTVRKRLNTLADGTLQAVVKGKEAIPHPAEALRTDFDTNRFATVDTDYATAMAYLRRESIVLPPDTPRGIVVITFMNHPLGFAKNLGNRANNLFPQEWKIKSTHIPTDYETIFRPAEPHTH